MAAAICDRHVLSCWYHGPAKLEYYLAGQMIGVDYDDETRASDIDVVANTNLIQRQAAIVYSTQSSTPERPRTRVLFLLESPIFDSSLHRFYARGLSGTLQGGKSETNPNRLFHGSGDEGRLIVLGNVIDNQLLQAIAQDYKDWGEQPREYNGPVTAEAREIRQALQKIPPDCPYDEWFVACAAVHSVFPGEEGIRLIEDWSPGYRGEVASKFKSFTTDRGITLRSLYYLAKKYETKSRN
jgi:hypothetical protein